MPQQSWTRLSSAPSPKVFSSASVSPSASSCNCAFAWPELLSQPLISLKPPPRKTESFAGSVGITCSCGTPLQKKKRSLMRSLPLPLPSCCPPLPLPFTLLLCCWMTAPAAFASRYSFCSSSWWCKLPQQPRRFDLWAFCSASCAAHCYPRLAAAFCSQCLWSWELPKVPRAPRGGVKSKARRKSSPFNKTPSNFLGSCFFPSALTHHPIIKRNMLL